MGRWRLPSGAAVRFVDPGPRFDMVGAPVTTDEDGRFSLSVIAGRTYRLQADWQSPIVTPERRFASTKSEPFEAMGAIAPFRLVLADVR